MDAAQEAPAPASTSDGQWQGFRRVVTHHLVVVDGRTYMVEETSFEPPQLQACSSRRAAASSDAILGLQEVGAGDATQMECAVCLQDLNAEETLRAMPCSHAFHQHSIFDGTAPALSVATSCCPRSRRTLALSS
ncbi:hypothetical protein SETIT_8G028200v2 [Setaria italica]|uniref:RING-type domain-containing protein n=1 Tax=Setaria italica TaxID=4555 RepID=K3ZMJ5_SETIT|nr:hypothetical protein SETIT_8G028200v2 [Setaria italica]